MLIEQRQGSKPIENPKLSPEGKPIIRIMDFGSSYFLRSDLFPNVITRINSYPKEEDLENFTELLITRAQKNLDWLRQEDHAEGREEIVDNLFVLLKQHKKHSNGNLTMGFEFEKEIGNPRELIRPYSYHIELKREGPIVEIDRKIALGFDNEWSGWGSFIIMGNKNDKVLTDKQIDKGLMPWKTPREFSMIQTHLSRARPRLFIGPNYEVALEYTLRDLIKATINSTSLANIEYLEFRPEYNFYIDQLRSHASSAALVLP